jgi:hypothetical protein
MPMATTLCGPRRDHSERRQVRCLERQNISFVFQQNRRIFAGLLNNERICFRRVGVNLVIRRMIQVTELFDLVTARAQRPS